MDPEVERLRDLHRRLIATAETVERHFAEAVEVKRQLDDLVAALGTAAERAASEAAQAEPRFIASRQVEVLDVGVE